MKKLLIINLVLIAASCEKKGQCYDCRFGIVNNYTPPPEKYCGKMPYSKKINGVDYPTYCTPK